MTNWKTDPNVKDARTELARMRNVHEGFSRRMDALCNAVAASGSPPSLTAGQLAVLRRITQQENRKMTNEKIAQVCHEVNRAYCAAIGDNSQPEWANAPAWQRESAQKGVEGIQSGTVTKPSDSHESWLAEKRATGWKYGPTKNPEAKEHPCFVEYAELPAEQQAKDALFFNTATVLLSLPA